MKMKEVCQQTGLTDRTVRLYISYGLVFPSYNENYTGRKNYHFNETDVQRLQQIAQLRRFGFSISNIKDMLDENRRIPEILNEHIDDLKKQIEKERAILPILENASSNPNIKDINTLCTLLRRDDQSNEELPDADRQPPYMDRYDKILWVFKVFLLIFAVLFLLYILGTAFLLHGTRHTLYGAKAMSYDSVVTEYFDESKIGNCRSYSYSLHLQSTVFYHADGSVLLAEYEAEDFDKQLEVIEHSYRFLNHQVLDEYNTIDYLSPPPVFTIGNWSFKTVEYHVLEEEEKSDYPKVFQMIAVNKKSQKIAYLDFCDIDLDYLGNPGDTDYMEKFIKDNFHVDFSRIP